MQEIPCEKTKHGYRIDVAASLDILKNRAADFAGHEYIFIANPNAQTRSRSKRGKSFLEMLDGLKKAK